MTQSRGPINLTELRERAERASARSRTGDEMTLPGIEPNEFDHLIEELRTYQAELEIQNQELNTAQQEITRALGKYRSLYENLPLPAMLVDGRGFMVEANQLAAELLGLNRLNNLSRISLYQLFESKSRTPLYAALQETSQRIPRALKNLCINCGSHVGTPCDVNLIRLGDTEAEGGHTLVVLVDKTAEKALAESDYYLRCFTNSSLVLIRVMDVDQRLNYINGGWLAFTGLTEQQALAGDSWRERLHPGETRRVSQAFADAFGRREEFRMDYRLRRHDGEYRWVRDESIPYWDNSGRFEGFVSHCQDIHDLVQAQREQARLTGELRLNEQRLRLAMEAAQDGLWDWKLQTGKVFYSSGWFRMLGYEADEFGEKVDSIQLFIELNHPDEREAIVEKARALLQTEGRYELEFRLRAKDGEYRWISSRGKVVERNAEGMPLRAIGTHTDITERRMAEDKILALNASLEQKVEERTAQLVAESAAKSEFLAHMSHEIRTPLNAVIGFAQVLEREFLTEEQLNFVLQIRESGQNLLHIINDILDFSKIEAGQLRIERVPFVLDGLLNPVKDLLWSSAETRGIRLNVEIPASIPGRLLGDDLRIRQVLINLLSNAIKFTEKGQVDLRVVQLALDNHQVRLRFEVRDTGIGISPSALSRLFQPFSQADGSITRRFGGTGLGLTISRRLVEMMSGTIGADSAPGEGSTFWFELPLQRIGEEEESIQPVTPTLPACHRLDGMRVLVVDDNRMNLLLVESALKKQNVETVLAGDGQQALEILRSQPSRFQAVLMDVQMPVMDGLTATRAIRNDPALSHLPVIALTAGVMPQERQAALEAGVNNFLSKPLELGQLLEVLEQCWQA